MRKIRVELLVDEDVLMGEADYTDSFPEAVSGELGWLRDSGMIVDHWEEIEEKCE